MSELSQLRLNIVYTPGSARHLQLFVFSLLKWLDCSFRLIANGCSAKEVHLLQELCRSNKRLEFFALPLKGIVRHGLVLSYLQAQERSEYFGFMDSDILATGDFLSEMIPHLDQCAGVFSGSPLFCKEDERILTKTFPKVGGRFSRTNTGMCLGSTYLAIYNNRILTQVMQATGVGFERYNWVDIPTQYKSWLTETGVEKMGYDTGKLLNLLLLAQGERLLFLDSPSLQHISGMSWYALQESGARRQSKTEKSTTRQIKDWLWQLLVIMGIETPQVRPLEGMEPEAIAQLMEAKARRGAVSRYFTEVLRSLSEDLPLPTAPDMSDTEIEREVASVKATIVALYEEFGEQLVR